MAENMACFEMEGRDRANPNNRLGVNVAKDLQYMRKNAAENKFNKIMGRLLAAKWFCSIVYRFRDYMRRMNNNVPVCCLKFLVILQYLLSYDFPLTKPLFYQVLERTVVVKEDHIRSIVHLVLRAARDAIKISPQEFLEYLESRGIQPCPELLNQIRALSQSSASGSQNQSRGSSPRSSPRGGLSSANGAMLYFEGVDLPLEVTAMEGGEDELSTEGPRDFVLDMGRTTLLSRRPVLLEEQDGLVGESALPPI